MTSKILLAAALALGTTTFAGAASAGQGHHGYGHYGYGAVIQEEAPVVVAVPETTGVYFKRSYVGRSATVQQCYKRRAWTSTGELFWSEVCQ